MSKFYVELNSDGVKELLRSAEMQSVLNQYGSQVQSRTGGDGYTVSVVQSSDRAKALVSAETKEAKIDNLENNTLVRALGV